MFLTDTCQRNGCKEIALWAPKLCIPVRGLEEVAPFDMLLSLELCPRHFYELAARDYVSDQVRGAVTEIMKRTGVEPDFEGAYFTHVHVTSREFRRFSRTAPGERRIFEVER
jgi:hypothetical protein